MDEEELTRISPETEMPHIRQERLVDMGLIFCPAQGWVRLTWEKVTVASPLALWEQTPSPT